jgi:hypothetical protein
MDGALQREAERLFGPGVELREGSARMEAAAAAEQPGQQGDVVLKRGKGLSDRQMRQLWNHVNDVENFWATLKEIEPGTLSRFSR